MHLAKARANKAKASTARAKAKASKDSTDRTRTRARIRLNVGIGKRGHYSKDCWSKKNTNKGGSKGKHKPKNADAHNLDSKPSIVEPEVESDEFSLTYLNVDALQQESEKMRGSEWIKIGVDTGAGKTAWPHSITYGTTILGDSDLTFRSATGELVKGGKRMHVVGCDDWGSNLRVRGVQAPVCKPLLSIGEYTTMGGVTVSYGDKGYTFHKGSNVAKKIDAWIQKELRDSQYRGCTIAYKENNVYNIYMKPKGNKIDAMPLSGDSESGVAGRSELVRPENPDPGGAGGAPDPEVPGGAHDPIGDDVHGDERVPNLPPQPSARQIAEHDLTGHAVYRSWCRHCVASKGRAHVHSSREDGELPEIGIDYGFFGSDRKGVLPIVSSVGTMQLDAWERQLLTGRASEYASSFLTAFIESGIQENSNEIRQ